MPYGEHDWTARTYGEALATMLPADALPHTLKSEAVIPVFIDDITD